MRAFFYIAAYDIRFSFRKNRLKWLATFLIQCYLCIRIFHTISFYGDSYDFYSELWIVMCGMREQMLSIEGAYWILFHGGTLMPEGGVLAIGVPIYDQSRIALFGAFLFLPCLVSLVLCELQVLLFFWLTPVLAFMMVFGYLIAAVFFQHPAFLGNFAMLYRQTWISENPALDLGTGMLLCILLSGAAFVIGMALFERKDILSQQGE